MKKEAGSIVMPFHVFSGDGHSCVLNIEKMRVTGIDRETAEALRRLDAAGTVPRELKPVLERLELLGEQSGAKASQSIQAAPPITNIALFVTLACNLRCVYCYEDKTGACMQESTAVQAVDWLMDQSGTAQTLHISFFGGEPFLNLSLMKKTAAYAREKAAALGKRVVFITTTNATLLDEEALAFVLEYDVDVLVSMDGPKELHDRQRPFPNGHGSYDVILPRVRRLLEEKPETRVHAVVVDADRTEVIKRSLREVGFREVTLLPVSAPLSGEERADRNLDGLFVALEGEARRWLELTADRDAEALMALRSQSHLAIALVWLLHNKKQRHACGAAVNYASVSCDGTLYLCHRFAGMEQYRLGTVFDGIAHRKGYDESPLVRSAACASCFARYYCAGWCKHDNLGATGSPWEASPEICALKRRELELAAGIVSRMGDEDKAFLIQNGIFPPKPCPLDF